VRTAVSTRLLILIFCFSLTGCYEGWEYDRQDNGEGPVPPPVENKLIHYILFQPIFPTSTGIDSGTCGVDQSFSTYRLAEWSSRVTAAAAALRELTDTFVEVDLSASSCSPFPLVDAASLESTPWGSGPEPTQDFQERQTIHLTAVFWDGDIAQDPGGFVNNRHWLAWNSMENGGRVVQSLRYFVISNDSGGYFSLFKEGTAAPSLSGTNIDVPNPTEAGIFQRNSTIEADTEALVAWVLTQSRG